MSHILQNDGGLLAAVVWLAGGVVCAAIVVSCVCRLDASRAPAALRLSVPQVMYLSFAFWAFGTLLDLVAGIPVRWHDVAAGLGIVAQLALSYPRWQGHDVVGDAIGWEDGSVRPANG